MTTKHRRWLVGLAWLAAGLIIAVAPWATAEDTPSPAGDETAQSEPPAQAGLKIFIDPETGEITDRPTAEQQAALAEAMRASLNKSAEGLETFDLAGGGHGVYLQGRFRSATIVRTRPDGSFEIQCVDHPDQAAELLATPASAAATPERVEQ
jgi:hypothetical protein